MPKSTKRNIYFFRLPTPSPLPLPSSPPLFRNAAGDLLVGCAGVDKRGGGRCQGGRAGDRGARVLRGERASCRNSRVLLFVFGLWLVKKKKRKKKSKKKTKTEKETKTKIKKKMIVNKNKPSTWYASRDVLKVSPRVDRTARGRAEGERPTAAGAGAGASYGAYTC